MHQDRVNISERRANGTGLSTGRFQNENHGNIGMIEQSKLY